MSQQLTTVGSRLPKPINANISQEQWRVLTDAIFPTAKTPEAVMLAMEYCRARNLDPFKRPVHIVPMWSTTLKRQVETVWPGINELQVTASRSGAWAGMDEPRFGPEQEYTFNGTTKDYGGGNERAVTFNVKAPEWCSIMVWKIVNGERCGFAGEPVYWLEAYARLGRDSELPNEMWRKRPRGQLMKCAKAAALRAAFPEDLGSTYAAEEMEDRETASTGATIDAVVETQAAHRAETAVQEEESEFIIRADSRLTAAAGESASAWLKAFLAIMGECPTLEEHTAICAWPSVQEAQRKAPKLVQAQLTDAIKAAETRLTTPTAPPPAEADTPSPATTDADALIKKLPGLKTDTDVVAWRISAPVKDAMGKMSDEARALVEAAIEARRGELNKGQGGLV